MRSIDVGVVRFTLDGAQEYTFGAAGCDANGTLPAVGQSPWVWMQMTAIGLGSVDLDSYFALPRGLAR